MWIACYTTVQLAKNTSAEIVLLTFFLAWFHYAPASGNESEGKTWGNSQIVGKAFHTDRTQQNDLLKLLFRSARALGLTSGFSVKAKPEQIPANTGLPWETLGALCHVRQKERNMETETKTASIGDQGKLTKAHCIHIWILEIWSKWDKKHGISTYQNSIPQTSNNYRVAILECHCIYIETELHVAV